MVRLTRAQQQERTRTAVLAAAEQEFAEQGYLDAKVDRIAERAELTRGAVYSNFPSKRALYLAVLVELVERGVDPPYAAPAGTLSTFARVWLERMPMVTDPPGGHLRLRSLAGVLDDGPVRDTFAQVTRLEAQLLGFALESGRPGRRVRQAELALTLLAGAAHLAEAAGVGDPFDVTRACEHLAGLDLDDTWAPPHLPYVAPAEPVDEPWAPRSEVDVLTGLPVDLTEDGVVVVLGTGRLSAVEEAVRAARPGDRVTVIVATDDPAERGRLVRLRVSDLLSCLRRTFAHVYPLRLVLDGEAGADDTETAVRVRSGRVVARATGRGAGHAAAVAGVPAR